jgi:adenylate cyclase class IV
MARNIEIKARIEGIEALLPKLAALADEGPIEILQDDWFFGCESGRLKLRAFSDAEGQLIFYRRPDQLGPKESSTQFLPLVHPIPCARRCLWPTARSAACVNIARCS